MAEAPGYTLDTSAVVVYFADEPGDAQIERLLAFGEREGKIASMCLWALPVRRLDHKDPDFRPLQGSIPLLELPLKPRRR